MTGGHIAVAITCHDLGRTLVEALDSVEHQTRPAAEIIIVDDGSGDLYTRQVLAELEQRGTRVAQTGGRGVSAARNLGARLTSSDYLVWLDADDVLEPSYFEAAAGRLDREADLDFVSSAMRAFGGASYVWTPSPPTFVDAVSTGGVPHASTMIRRRLWERVGGFDEELPSYELLDFWATAIELGFHGIVLDEPLINYRVRPGSGYRRSIESETYLARLRHFYSKHRSTVEPQGEALLLAKERFLLSQRDYRDSLEAKTASLEQELTRLQLEIADVARTLESRGLARVDWGDLRRLQPLSPHWGRDRGTAIDRYYIETFLERHRLDVRGRVLEVRDSTYTRRFGGEAVALSDVVDRDAANQHATVIADLRRADRIPSGTYDCVILTQTLQLVDDIPAVIAECARLLSPGGVLLATAPCVIKVDDEAGRDGDYWRLTEASARKLLADVFPIDAFEVTTYGNVMTGAAFLYGMSVEELAPGDLDHADPSFPVVVAFRAVKSQPPEKSSVTVSRDRAFPAAILAYHRVAALTPDSHALCTPPAEFLEHMRYLREKFLPISLEDLVRAAASGRIPEGAVAVTLDDGYVDALTTASPILSEHGVPATFFVNSDRLDEEHERMWDVLENLFLSDATLPPVLVLEGGRGSRGGNDSQSRPALRVPTATGTERAEALNLLNRTAWPLDADGRADLAAEVLAWSRIRAVPRATHRVLTADEIRELANRPGHSIGAHTTHHLALPTQKAATKRSEVLENKRTLECVLGRPVEVFAYPYGEFDGETVAIVKDVGFRAAVTVQPGLVSAGTNRLLLPRWEITPAHHGRFAQRMREILAPASS